MKRIIIGLISLLVLLGVNENTGITNQLYLPIISSQSGLQVLSNYSYNTGGDYVYILGEVKNNTSGFVQDIKIPVTYFDAQGQRIPSINYLAIGLRSALASGDITSFIHEDRPLAPGFSYFIFGTPTYSVGGNPAPDLTILNMEFYWSPLKNCYIISGTVRNDDSSSIDYARVMETYYDSSGKILYLDAQFADPTILKPDQTGSIYGEWSPGKEIPGITYRAQVDGVKLP
jgi:hypothetical protein